MNNEATLQKLQTMKLYGMANSFRNMLDSGLCNELSSGELLGHLVDSEYDARYNRRLLQLIKNANFRFNTGINEIKYSKDRNLSKSVIIDLSDCNWIKKGENILITGSTGVGKSYLACALGNQACLNGYKVLYLNSIKTFSELKMAKNDGSYYKLLSKILKNDLLIIDDFGLHPIDNIISMMLLEILEDKYGKNSIIITSQYPDSNWFDLIPDKTYADAICDRLIHNSIRIQLEGETMRRTTTKKISKLDLSGQL